MLIQYVRILESILKQKYQDRSSMVMWLWFSRTPTFLYCNFGWNTEILCESSRNNIHRDQHNLSITISIFSSKNECLLKWQAGKAQEMLKILYYFTVLLKHRREIHVSVLQTLLFKEWHTNITSVFQGNRCIWSITQMLHLSISHKCCQLD